ncbi:MAG: tetraacyldisaccharide 4'-kinase [Candidatus Eisenbacteria bacterium]|uniref:Tetraacyldisaccharide 4'-kinase n=1 Tax=Eiseniibacteriota bacterium TaxID=2212470 RepID=A0A933SC25_UNCEI|nr:tetraacyldisaccharide 4'-kinase [Candidatus Eisenbacteria bacterium]
MAGVSPWAAAAEALYAGVWEARRRWYASGLARAESVDTRVVSIGNLTVGGAGKTTCVLHLAREAERRGVRAAIVCRRYRPGPQGEGDEERMYRFGVPRVRCHAGTSKRDLARAAAEDGARLVLVDDGFSHWALARDADVVLLDRTDLFGGGRLLPAGRLREPLRALQRASAVVITRLEEGDDPEALVALARPYAPGAIFAAACHRGAGVVSLKGAPCLARGAARVLTATGNPAAVAKTAAEAGFGPVELSAWRDHHWWTAQEARREIARAGEGTLVLTRKDAVRWPLPADEGRVAVLEVEWAWVRGGEAVERHVFGEASS